MFTTIILFLSRLLNQNPQIFSTGHFGPDYAEEGGRLHPVKSVKKLEGGSKF